MRLRTAVLFCSMLLLGTLAFAQTETGRISGTVLDPQDRVVPGVTVTATNVGTGAMRTTVTDADGKYVIANVQPAQYDVKFTLSGFKATDAKITVPVGQAVNVDTKLQVGGTTETVTVTGVAEIVNTANAEVEIGRAHV